MKSFKKLFALVLSVALISSAITAGTIAYLTSEDSDVNVMTLGNVKIEQHEYERVVENGTYKTDTIDNQNSYVLENFSQNKPLYPIVGDPNEPGNSPAYAGYDETTVRMSQVDSYGGMQVFAGKNAQDKFVTVENTGKSDAYVRTIVAIEIGSTDGSKIMTSARAQKADATGTQPWISNSIGAVVINGNTYRVVEYVYRGASDVNRHVNGVLPAGDTTYPSLCQVYLKHNATNENMVAIDGNGNGTLDILVLSQAVQVEGFADAKTALDTAFGKTAEEVAKWFGETKVPTYVTEDVKNTSTTYGSYTKLGEYTVFENAEIISNGGGVDIRGTAVFNSGSVVLNSTSTSSRHVFYVGAKDGEANGHLTINGGEFKFNPTNLTRKGYYICADGEGAKVIVNGGSFDKPSTRPDYKAGIAEINGGEVIIYGGTFAFDPTDWVAEGYEAVLVDGLWTVSAK